ncbi:MAG TPA: hypothetical protein PLG38_10385, partial [Propionibacteriaceae bacterium]|nr:hypothetical protein [Propionibacteriaceae bacterium]
MTTSFEVDVVAAADYVEIHWLDDRVDTVSVRSGWAESIPLPAILASIFLAASSRTFLTPPPDPHRPRPGTGLPAGGDPHGASDAAVAPR